MNNIIIGTAGHIDHGKTSLIQALTGIDTDRLKEEKKRGITIELGFAYLDLPGGGRAGIIDVPGHERFVKNMLAGAGGIDMALLVIAADDGVMPQTREHLGILRLLGIEAGLIALTKTDLVEEDWLELVMEDVRKEVSGTFLQDAPILPVSAYTGAGLDALRQALYALSTRVSLKNTAAPFRLPVDRVFTMDGFGTVVTGTLIEGALRDGDEVELYPSRLRARARKLQVHASSVDTAYAGQRVAVNLAGLKKDEVRRGDTLAAINSMEPSMMLDVRLHILEDSARIIENGTRLHFYHGANVALAKLILLAHSQLGPGEEGYAQLRFTEQVAAKAGDRFVLRFYSPIETVGGGVVLDANAQKHRRNQPRVLTALRVREQGTGRERLLQAISDGAMRFLPFKEAQARCGLPPEACEAELAALLQEGSVTLLQEGVYVDAATLEKLRARAASALQEYHAQNPLQAGMKRDELRARLAPGQRPPIGDKLIALFLEEGLLRESGQRVALAGFEIAYSEADKALRAAAEDMYRKGGYAPPDVTELLSRYPKEKAALKQVLEAMLAEGLLIMGSRETYFHAATVQDAEARLRAFLSEHGEITLADFRDLIGASRKYALALLDHFDRMHITKKVGDSRKLVG